MDIRRLLAQLLQASLARLALPVLLDGTIRAVLINKMIRFWKAGSRLSAIRLDTSRETPA